MRKKYNEEVWKIFRDCGGTIDIEEINEIVEKEKQKKKIVNFFLWIAVPVISFGKFYCTDIGGDNIAIIGRRTGLPAIWERKYLLKHWWDVKHLVQCEWETEAMSYRNFIKNIIADDEINVEELVSFNANK